MRNEDKHRTLTRLKKQMASKTRPFCTKLAMVTLNIRGDGVIGAELRWLSTPGATPYVPPAPSPTHTCIGSCLFPATPPPISTSKAVADIPSSTGKGSTAREEAISESNSCCNAVSGTVMRGVFSNKMLAKKIMGVMMKPAFRESHNVRMTKIRRREKRDRVRERESEVRVGESESERGSDSEK